MKTTRITALLTSVYLLTVAAMIWFVWNEWNSYQTAKSSLINQLRIVELRSDIVHYDEVLSMSARMAAATGDLQWEERYRSFKPKLDASIAEAELVSPEPYRAEALASAKMANLKLVEMEQQSFGLVRQGRIEEARALLFSDEYDRQKVIYAQRMTQFAAQIPPFAQLEELRGIIIHLDEVLTMSARMAAATEDLQWEQRYRYSEPILDAAIKDAMTLAPNLLSNQAVAETDAANIKLIQMENQSFDLVRSGRADEARAFLFGDEYKRQKAIYSQGMEEFSVALAGLAHSNMKQLEKQAMMRVFFTLVLLLLLLVAWAVVLRVVSNWVETLADKRELEKQIAKRQQAEEALKLANQDLIQDEMRLKESQKIAHLGHWGLNLVSNELKWSDEIYRIFEIDPSKFGASYEAFLELIHPEDRDRVNQAYTNSLHTKEPYEIVHRLLMPDGRIKYVREACDTQFNDQGEPLISIGTVQDITETEKVRLSLANEKERIDAIQRLQSRFIDDPTPHHICQGLLADFKKLTGSEYGLVGEVYSTPEGNPYLSAYAIDMLAWNKETRALYEEAKGKGFEFHKLDNLFGHVILDREVVISNDPEHDPRRAGLPAGHPAINNFLGIPVFQGEKLVGEIGLANREGGYDQELLDYICPLVSAFGQIIVARQAQEARDAAEKALAELAKLDGLLGIPNRRSFDDFLEQQWKQARRDQKSLSLIMIDIDHFKLYNDHYGHQQGDRCLVQVAKLIEKSLRRPSDLAARYGGEEFACVLPDTSAEGAEELAEAIRVLTVDKAIPHTASPLASHVTLSIGVATLVPSSETSADELISLADQALYQAKSEGRNRIVNSNTKL